jgi:hypothetical protein
MESKKHREEQTWNQFPFKSTPPVIYFFQVGPIA